MKQASLVALTMKFVLPNADLMWSCDGGERLPPHLSLNARTGRGLVPGNRFSDVHSRLIRENIFLNIVDFIKCRVRLFTVYLTSPPSPWPYRTNTCPLTHHLPVGPDEATVVATRSVPLRAGCVIVPVLRIWGPYENVFSDGEQKNITREK